MKALITASVATLMAIASVQAFAHHHRYHRVFVVGPVYVPTATCVTNATKAPLPEYVCCKMRDSSGHVAWRNQWVSGGCQSIGASYALRCNMASPVYNTGAGIIGQCQFSQRALLMHMSAYKDGGVYTVYTK